MKNLIINLNIIFFFLLAWNTLTAQPPSGTLTFNANNFHDGKGVAKINLFRKGDDVPKKPFLQSTAEIVNGIAVIKFENIPLGQYAAILFHDVNSNGTLDHKLGFPNEPMGFSNGWTLSLFSGMPSFEKLKFDFREDVPFVEIPITRK